MTRILVVDDEPQILRAMRINLRARHYDVDVAADGTTALRDAAHLNPDLVVLDLGLPDIDGVEVIHGLRGWTHIPIIVLSGRTGSQDKVEAIDAGADDYVTKPFNIDELIARIRAVTRRAALSETSPTVRIGDHVIDLAAKTIRAAEQADGGAESSADVRLTPTEWHLLEMLVRNPGNLISQRQLLTELWGRTYIRETRYLRQYMAQLRRNSNEIPPTRATSTPNRAWATASSRDPVAAGELGSGRHRSPS
jgi:two-component system, OmpR family, KDP operon response regulator KdpE